MDLHDSVVSRVIDALDLRSRMAVLCTCKRMKRLCERPDLWRRICFDSADEQRGLKADWLLGVLGRAQGGVEVLHLARSREARAAEGQQRFSDGLKMDQLLPHTQGPGALRLAALCPRLVHVSIDERASCLGGMTNCLARALGSRCPLLESLEVYFERYSLPGELFTDEGLIALSEGCRRLRSLALVNCDYVSDRALYAVAANCRGLQELQLGGYSENITDIGLSVLLDACPTLRVLWLGGKLLKVTDATLAALTRHSPSSLQRIKLTRSMTSSALRRLSHCRELVEIDARHISDGDVPDDILAELARACPNLRRIALPPEVYTEGDDGAMMQGGSTAASVDEEEEEEEASGLRVGSFEGGGGAANCGVSGARGARMLHESDVRRFALQGVEMSHHCH